LEGAATPGGAERDCMFDKGGSRKNKTREVQRR
jgi:hypothetical protein